MTDRRSKFTVTSIRAFCALLIIALVALPLIPLQYLSVLLDMPSKRWIPVLFHRIVCRTLGIKVVVRGLCTTKGSVLITANHASWLDISVLSSVQPVSFIAKSEVANWPIFGMFAKLQRSIFVNRSKRSETGNVAKEIAKRLKEGDAMVLFAEGTSSNGNEVRPFRTALIGAAKAAMVAEQPGAEEKGQTSVWIQPLSVAYTGIQGLPMGRQHRHIAAWYGDMDLAPHLWAVAKEGAIDVTLTFGEPIPFGADADRKEAARKAEATVRANMLKTLHHHNDGKRR
ncbi:1-acyl-sn-glycerol-3-phosphate acyltransferase [Cohaesibacter sp. ES.047]|uniref:lysophospholipid acyltransferase family protein n=1 Tax=Cohaesibacter sp. ES.047 TaxID=1798205 RepID=UPI000BC0BB12|nr:lysophospholipid acyltransferase family protein [Cohaesibacter sp. ES.047]SNY90385.1 1-acyl-sn-glycerol-3-phosphate acyltransferase [Cohaesibacter sp. ES.047]